MHAGYNGASGACGACRGGQPSRSPRLSQQPPLSNGMAPAAASAAPSRCAECGALLADALVLTCGHDLCLGCAAQALKQTRSSSGRAVRCLLCSVVTELCEEAAAALIGTAATANGRPPAHVASAEPFDQQQHQSSSGRPLHTEAAALQRMSLWSSSVEPEACVAGQPRIVAPQEQRQESQQQWGFPAPRPCSSNLNGAAPLRSPRGEQPVLLSHMQAFGGRSERQVASAVPAHASSSGWATLVTSHSASSSPTLGMSHEAPRKSEFEAAVGALSLLPISSTCPEHPDEQATYFCATCECSCICAECIVHGPHRGHEVMRVGRALEALRARAGALLDEAQALEDDFAVVTDKLSWRRKDIERAVARGRASVRSAFARVRAQLADREAELLDSLDSYESESLGRLDRGTDDHDSRLNELRRLQDSLRARCRSGEAVEALNAYAAAKAAIVSLRETFSQEEVAVSVSPEEFVGLASSARQELDLHAEGLASLEEAVSSLCERGAEFHNSSARAAGALSMGAGSERRVVAHSVSASRPWSAEKGRCCGQEALDRGVDGGGMQPPDSFLRGSGGGGQFASGNRAASLHRQRK